MKTVIESPQEDSSVVADCLRGNRDAFEILVRRYQSLICALIYSRCGNVTQSEDLGQETFVAAWKSLATLRDTAHFVKCFWPSNRERRRPQSASIVPIRPPAAG